MEDLTDRYELAPLNDTNPTLHLIRRIDMSWIILIDQKSDESFWAAINAF